MISRMGVSVAAVLARSGGRVTTAGSVAEALQAVRKVAPDVLVSDIEMPNEDGYALIERVRKEHGGAIPALSR